MSRATVVDLFCGAGGLTRGFLDAGLDVVAGYDVDEACRFAYESNNHPSRFILRDVAELSCEEVASHFGPGPRILAGCAPCQPFSKYQREPGKNQKDQWRLLYEFSRLVQQIQPEVISVENVPQISHHRVLKDFLQTLSSLGYEVDSKVVRCSEYGVPQTRKRFVLIASKLGPIELIPATHRVPRTVKDAIADLPPLSAGGKDSLDTLHRCRALRAKNLERIKSSVPGGTWRDWPEELRADCHRRDKGKTYPSVYGRMEWEKPAPTVTTQFFGYGNGRFGHPSQDRAISLREGARLQSFGSDYTFEPCSAELPFETIGRFIGNAVPVLLARAVGISIQRHLEVV